MFKALLPIFIAALGITTIGAAVLYFLIGLDAALFLGGVMAAAVLLGVLAAAAADLTGSAEDPI